MKLLTLFLLTPLILLAQKKPETFDIKYAGENNTNKCGEYLETYSRLPAEVRYGIEIQNDIIYFYLPDTEYFDLLFDKNTDGIAIDIVRREQYKCYAKHDFTKSWANRGHLMKPMYLDEISKNTVINEQGYVIVEYGPLPSNFDRLNIETNLLVLQKRYLCGYHSFSNLDYSNWGLLDMGMYRDSLSSQELQLIHKEVSKDLTFTIPFEKDQTEFDRNDIQPLYDSLDLTDYNIKEVTIRAYTSVEGTLERNIELQTGRANSIVAALQSYQTPEITSHITANENWVEFLRDIEGSRFSYLKRLSKDEIKNELEKKEVLASLEPILRAHRKALIELSLQKKFSLQEDDPEMLLSFFNQNIQEKNIQEALYLQKIIFEKIRDHQLPDLFIGKLEIPEESFYGPLLNNLAIFSYYTTDLFLYESISNFERLLTILPGNIKVKYNLTVLKIMAWTEGDLVADQFEIRKLIDELEQLGLDPSLVRRLNVNYHIILTQYHHLRGDYRNKNISLKEVYREYSRLKLDDIDLLSLAKYLAINSKFDWAEHVLYERINEVSAAEDLIFYYLVLTINDSRRTRQSDYRAFMLNAIEKNNRRFCDVFLPTSQGGYTFQLLDNEFLRKTYCENCN